MASTGTNPRILVLTYTLISREPRALKQISYLKSRFNVTTAGFGPAPDPSVQHIELTQETAYSHNRLSRLRYVLMLALRRYRLVNKGDLRDRAAFDVLSVTKWDLIIAHDVKTISLANRLASARGVLSDLHEYAPRQGENVFAWQLLIAPYFRWLCRTEVAKAAAVTTVSQGIVDEYRKQFGIVAHLDVNASPYQALSPGRVTSPIRLVHSGVAGRARKLEVMIEAVLHTTADVTLDLYLVQNGSSYFGELQRLAGSSERISFRDPVPYDRLVQTLNDYDVGLSIIAPTTFNLAWCLPNKFFDYVQARLGVIIGPSPEMSRIIQERGFGTISENFSAPSLAHILETITPGQVRAWKDASDEHARDLSAEEQLKVWGMLVDKLLIDRGRRR